MSNILEPETVTDDLAESLRTIFCDTPGETHRMPVFGRRPVKGLVQVVSVREIASSKEKPLHKATDTAVP